MVGYVTISQLIATSIQNRSRAPALKEQRSYELSFSSHKRNMELGFLQRCVCTILCPSKSNNIGSNCNGTLYPEVLIITGVILEVYNQYTATRSCWKPLSRIRHTYRKYCDFRGSIIDAFASVLILSYVMILNTSTELMFKVHFLTWKVKY